MWPTFLRHKGDLGANARPLDVRDRQEVRRVLKEAAPQVIFHLAYDMQDLEGTVVEGSRNLLEEWGNLREPGLFLHMSTDMVFDGENGPYSEGDLPRPLTPYGLAKLEAETLALKAGARVIRISLVYGFNPLDPRTASLQKGLREGRFDYPYFEDEVRCPIFLQDLCLALVEMAAMAGPLPQILHLAGPVAMSRYSLACHLAQALGWDPVLVPRARLAGSGLVRPRDLRLDSSAARGLLSWSPRSVEEVLRGHHLLKPGLSAVVDGPELSGQGGENTR